MTSDERRSTPIIQKHYARFFKKSQHLNAVVWAQMSNKHKYWWLADRIECEEQRKATLKRGLLDFFKTQAKDKSPQSAQTSTNPQSEFQL